MAKTFRMPAIPPKLKAPEPPKVYGSLGKEAEIGFQVSDATGMIETLLSLPQVALDSAGYEMARMGQEIIEEAQEPQNVPVDTGNLRDSGDYDNYEPNRGQTLAQIGVWFAGDATAEQIAHGRKTADVKTYALEQHENRSLRHPHGGRAKFLEIPFTNKISEMQERIAAAIRSALGGDLLRYLTSGNAGTSEPLGPVPGKYGKQ